VSDGRSARAAQSARTATSAKAAGGRRPRVTGRAAVLALVFCSLIAVLAYPTRQFIAQRAQIAQQQVAARQAQAQVDELRRERARWQDPAYVEAQARERLHYAFPGETPLVAVDPSPGASVAPSAQRGSVTQPWYDSLFETLDTADAATH
jgi:cell division protein FtsB